jgi:outer membrane receptor protein involved in Fe transport
MTTTRPRRYRAWRELLALPAFLALGLTAHAQVTPKAAAPEDTSLQEVIVTGSRIARPEFDNLEPTASVDSKTFDQRGYLDVGQALSELPAFGTSPSSSANTQSGFGIAQSFVDLYGLGSQRTPATKTSSGKDPIQRSAPRIARRPASRPVLHRMS